MRSALLLALCLLLGCAGCGQKHWAELHRGGAVDLNQLAGQVLVINYWADWCAPCKEEIPELNQLDQHRQVTVLGVDFDGHRGAALAQRIAAMGIDFGVLAQRPQVGLLHPGLPQQPPSLPTTYLLDLRGQTPVLSAALAGPQTERQLLAAIEPSRAD